MFTQSSGEEVHGMGGGHTLFVLLQCYYFLKISLGGSCDLSYSLTPLCEFLIKLHDIGTYEEKLRCICGWYFATVFPLLFKVNSSSFDQSRKKENVYYGVRVTVDNENKTWSWFRCDWHKIKFGFLFNSITEAELFKFQIHIFLQNSFQPEADEDK